MSVYVDQAENRLGRMLMCHMIADTPAELKAMAVKIGVGIHWFQEKASAPHFDIAKSKRLLAVTNGALVLGRTDFVAKLREIKATWPRSSEGEPRWLL